MKKRKRRLKINLINFLNIFLFLVIIFVLSFIKFDLYLNKNYLKKISIFEFLLIKRGLVNKIFSNNHQIIKIKTHFYFQNKKIKLETIQEKPVAKICHLNHCYLLGEHNYIYDNKKELENSLLLAISSKLPIYPNSILEKNLANALAKIFEYSNLNNLYLSKVEILSNKDLLFATPQFYFLIDPNKNLYTQIKKLDYFLKNYSKKFQYLDLRIPNKIYFR